MTSCLDLRAKFAHEICAEVTRKLHGEELDTAIDALISVREELDNDRLKSVGILLLNDGSVLLHADPEVLRHITRAPLSEAA